MKLIRKNSLTLLKFPSTAWTQHRLCCWSLPGSYCQSDTESFSTLTLMTEVLSGISPKQKADGALRT